MDNKSTFIRIVKVPEGEAPLEVRKKWVGLVLPCLGINTKSEKGYGLVSNNPTLIGPYRLLVVPQKEALDILRQSSPEAVRWFEKNGYPEEGMSFGFCENEVQLISK